MKARNMIQSIISNWRSERNAFHFFHVIKNTASSQAICTFKLQTWSFTHLLPVMPFLYCFKRRSHTQSRIFFLYSPFPIFALFSDTPFRILQINSLHLKCWDLDHWTSGSGSVVPEKFQSHRLCYPELETPHLLASKICICRPPPIPQSLWVFATVATHHSPNHLTSSVILHSHGLALLISSTWHIGCYSVKEAPPGRTRCKALCSTARSLCHGDMPLFCQATCCDTSPILRLVAWCA